MKMMDNPHIKWQVSIEVKKDMSYCCSICASQNQCWVCRFGLVFDVHKLIYLCQVDDVSLTSKSFVTIYVTTLTWSMIPLMLQKSDKPPEKMHKTTDRK